MAIHGRFGAKDWHARWQALDQRVCLRTYQRCLFLQYLVSGRGVRSKWCIASADGKAL